MKNGTLTSLLVSFVAVLAGFTASTANAGVGVYESNFQVRTDPNVATVPYALAVDPGDRAVYVAANTYSYNSGLLFRVGSTFASSWYRSGSDLPANMDYCHPSPAATGGEADLQANTILPNADGSSTVLNTPHPWSNGSTGCSGVKSSGFLEFAANGTYTGSLGDRGYDNNGYTSTFFSNGLYTSPPGLDPEQSALLDVARNSASGQYYQLWVANTSGYDPSSAVVVLRNVDGTITDTFYPQIASVNYRPHIAVNSSTGEVYISSNSQGVLGGSVNGQPSIVKYSPGSWEATSLELSTTALPPAYSWPAGGTDGYIITGLAVDSANDRLYAVLNDGYSGSGNYGDYGQAKGILASWQSDLFTGTINATSTPAGSLNGSQQNGIAVDPVDGSVYVSDPGHRLVAHFSPEVVPTVGSGTASAVDPHTETLTGVVNPSGLPINSCAIEYGATSSFGNSVPCDQSPASIGAGYNDVEVTATITVPSGTKLHYRFKATNENGTEAGFDQSFVSASPSPPSIVEPLTADTSNGQVTVQGSINPHYGTTSYHFVYGTTTSYGQQTASQVLPFADDTAHAVSQQLPGGLTPGGTYHFALVASNSAGSSTSNDFTFVAPAVAPQIVNVSTGSPGQTYATFNATVNAGGSPTSCEFQFVSDADYQPAGKPYVLGSSVAATPSSFSGSGNTVISGTATGLEPFTLYHMQPRCQNAVGASADPGDFTFKTAPLPPEVSGLTAVDIGSTSATLEGQVVRNSDPASYHFEWGVNTTYGLRSVEATIAADGTVSAPATGLAPLTPYHFRLVATGADGFPIYSQDATFTTAAATVPVPPTQPPSDPPAAPPVAPEVFFYSGPQPESSEQQASFVFSGSSSVTHYECAVDASSWIPCTSPFSTAVVPGDHKFQVRGLTDGGQASNIYTYWWTVDLPKSCIVKTARAHMLVSQKNQRLHLATKYTAYSPAKNVVGRFFAKLKGGKKLMLGASTANFKTAGVFKIVKPVGAKVWKKVKTAKSFGVQLSVPHTQASCGQYLTKALTVKKLVGHDPVWFQSDSIFTKAGPRL